MSKRSWGSGDVVSRRVGSNLETILPESLSRDDNVHFTAYGAMRQSVLPNEAIGGVLELTAMVGMNSQFTVDLTATMQRRAASGGDAEAEDWTVRTSLYRAEGHGPSDLDPFRYAVEWRTEQSGQSTTDSGVVSLGTVANSARYGRSEGAAALLLTEILANRKAKSGPDRSHRVSHAGSLAMLGSFSSAVDAGRIPGPDGPLGWELVDEWLGPDSETLAAQTSVQTTVPEKQRRAAAKGIDFLHDDLTESDPEETEETGVGARLATYLQEIDAMAPQIEGPPVLTAPERITETRNRLGNKLRGYPDGFPEALDEGNFGVAKRRGEAAADPYEKMVLVYAFYELYGVLSQLQESEEAVRQIDAAITAFGKAIDRGNTEMAELSLKRASDAFVTITKQLVEGAESDLEELRSLLAYHGLEDVFDRHVAGRDELDGTDLAYYEAACEDLVESARRQHGRAEKAREAFYLFANSTDQ